MPEIDAVRAKPNQEQSDDTDPPEAAADEAIASIRRWCARKAINALIVADHFLETKPEKLLPCDSQGLIWLATCNREFFLNKPASDYGAALPASPYTSHDFMETDAARTGKDQGWATRDAGRGRAQHAAKAPRRTQAVTQDQKGSPLATVSFSASAQPLRTHNPSTTAAGP
jgi:hypothetical protein